MTQAIQTAPPGHYRVKHVVKSEVLKILTLRSTAITLGLTVVAGLLVTGLVANADLHHNSRLLHRLRPDPKLADRPDRRRPDRRRVRGVAHHRRVLERHHPRAVGRHPETAHPAGGQDRRRRRRHCGLLRAAQLRRRSSSARPSFPAAGLPRPASGRQAPLRAVVMTGVFIALMALMSFGFGLILRSTAGGDRRLRRRRVRAPARDARHFRTRPSLRADQHPHQLDHVHRQPRTGGDPPTALAGRRVVADGHLCRDRPRRRRRAVRQARRLSEAGAEGRWVQIRIPAERAEQAKRLARLIAREPFQKRSLGGAGVLPRQLRPGLCGGACLWLRSGSPGWCSRSCSSASLSWPAACGPPEASAAGNGRWRGGCWARRSPNPSRSPPVPGLFGWLRASLGDRAAWRAVGYFVAKVPLTVFGVWFALSVWVEALSGIASPLIGWRRAGQVRPLWPARSAPATTAGRRPGSRPTSACS